MVFHGEWVSWLKFIFCYDIELHFNLIYLLDCYLQNTVTAKDFSLIKILLASWANGNPVGK